MRGRRKLTTEKEKTAFKKTKRRSRGICNVKMMSTDGTKEIRSRLICRIDRWRLLESMNFPTAVNQISLMKVRKKRQTDNVDSWKSPCGRIGRAWDKTGQSESGDANVSSHG